MDLDEVQAMAKRVMNEHAVYERAKDDKAQAEDELLVEFVKRIKPALPAMCSKMVPQGQLAGPITRAVVVDKTQAVYLGEEGDWFVLEMKVVGGEGLTVPRVLTTSEVLDYVDLAILITSLVQSLWSQAGARDKSTAKIQLETERLRAIATLLK